MITYKILLEQFRKSISIEGKPQFYGPHNEREEIKTKVRIGDIITHEKPNSKKVAELKFHIMSGKELPLPKIDTEWKEHFKTSPTGMKSIGFGYGLLDGHHRVAAYRSLYGNDHEIDALYDSHK